MLKFVKGYVMFKWLSNIISLLPFRRIRIYNCDKMVKDMGEVCCLLKKTESKHSNKSLGEWFKVAVNAVKSISRGN